MAIRLAVLVAVAYSVSAVHLVPAVQLSLLNYGSSGRFSKIMANMSTQDALRLVPSLPEDLLKKIQCKLKKDNVAFLQRTDCKDAAGGADTTDAARKLLNEMGVESEVGLDTEKIRCAELLEKQALALQANRNELNDYNAQAAAARGSILEAQGIISAKQALLPTLNDELVGHRKKCVKNKFELEAQLKIARGDLAVLSGILPKTSCAALLLQCERVGDYTDVTFKHPALREKMSMLQSTAVKQMVQRTLHMLGTQDAELPAVPQKVASPGSEARAKSNTRCSIHNSPNCGKLRAKFVLMQGEIVDTVRNLEETLSESIASCDKTDEDLVSQISDAEAKLNDAQTTLAQSTKAELSAKEQSRLLVMSIAELEDEERKIKAECDKNIGDIEMEICGIKQIRAELYKMSKVKKYIQDCVVTDWVPEECSASCEGGTQKIERSIQVPANMGMKCPPLQAMRACNDFTCPVDCVLEDWSGWSACSAECNGGVKQRVREIGRKPEHGGEPCGATSDSESCNTQSCDKDCVLSDWSPWSNCSKECDVGSTVRVKEVTEAALGTGFCAESDSETRLERKACNTFKCGEMFEAKDGLMHCTSMLDVILLLDGSISIGEDGWKATQKVAEAIVKSLNFGDNAAQMAVLSYSGPEAGPALNKCVDGDVKDFEKECNVKWLSHFDTDPAAVTGTITSAAFPKGSTLTSAALAMAESEFGSGRRDARKVTIVITDDRPYSIEATKEAALSLRKKSRLMFVAVGDDAPISDIHDWATAPPVENIIVVKDFEELALPETANRITADSCPNLEEFPEEKKAES